MSTPRVTVRRAVDLLPRQREVLSRDCSPRSVEVVERHANYIFPFVRNFARIAHVWIKRKKRFFAIAIIKLQAFIVDEHSTCNTHVDLDSEAGKRLKQMRRRRG